MADDYLKTSELLNGLENIDINTIQFSHTDAGKAYSNVDMEDSAPIGETTSNISYANPSVRGLITDETGKLVEDSTQLRNVASSSTSNLGKSEYDRSGSLLPRDKFNEFLELIHNESIKMAGWGSLDSIFENFVSNLDRFGSGLVPMNTLNTGYTFITRPRLNLTTGNLRQNPILGTLNSWDPGSVSFMIRALLDPVMGSGFRLNLPSKFLGGDDSDLFHTEMQAFYEKAKTSKLLDVDSPFLIPLCNGLRGISGFPDLNVETETTTGDFHSGDYTFAKGSDMNNRTQELTLEFKDIQGSIIMSIIFYWVLCIALEAKGVITAYPDDIYEQRLNYTVSIYRFVMDPAKKHILWWGKATGCYPKSAPVGSLLNVSQGEVILTAAQNFSIPFVANNIKINDPSILTDFNKIVSRYKVHSYFYGDIDNFNNNRLKNDYVTISSTEPRYNFMGIPFVESTPTGLQLVWKIEKSKLEAERSKWDISSNIRKAVDDITKAKEEYQQEIKNKIINNSAEDITDSNSSRRSVIARAMQAELIAR